ncbi:drug resistance protein [Apiospora arundinis]
MLLPLLVALTEGNVVGWRTACVPALLIDHPLPSSTHLHHVGAAPRGGSTAAATAPAVHLPTPHLLRCPSHLLHLLGLFQQLPRLCHVLLPVLPGPGRDPDDASLPAYGDHRHYHRLRDYTVALWGTMCVSLACLLFAVRTPADTTSYWAYDFPAMILLTLGADRLYHCTALFVMKSITEGNQAMGAVIFQTLSQLGRSIGLAITTVIQIALTKIQGRQGLDGEDRGALRSGYRAAYWFSFAMGMSSIAITAYSFRGAGKLGN